METSWKRLGGEVVHDAGIFRVRKDRYLHHGRPTHPYHVIEAAPWVNVVATTRSGEIVLVRQFRHGIQAESLELPGGIVDPDDKDPTAGASRELLEETGYRAERWVRLGAVTSNPAILENRTFCYRASQAERVAAPAPGRDEELVVELHPPARVRELLRAGRIHHSLCVAALGLHFLPTDA